MFCTGSIKNEILNNKTTKNIQDNTLKDTIISSTENNDDFYVIKIPKSKMPFLPNDSDELMVLRIKPEDALELNKLSQYFECPYEGLVGRGLWLLSTFRNADICSQNMCIVEREEFSGKIVNISPIIIN
jgi:hypothetical protein